MTPPPSDAAQWCHCNVPMRQGCRACGRAIPGPTVDELRLDLAAARARIAELTDALETIAATEEHHSSRLARKALETAKET